MLGRIIGGIAVAAMLLVGGSCGGGGGGPPGPGDPVADLEGGWFGPTGATGASATSVGTGTGGMLADANGNVLDFPVNGVSTGVQGIAFTIDATNLILGFTRNDGRSGYMMLSPDRNHLLYIDSAGTFGAWQKGATSLSTPYDLSAILNSAWTARHADVTPALQPTNVESGAAQIDGAGVFTAGDYATDVTPIALLEAVNGQYAGDFESTEGAPTSGPVLMLITPDLLFMAVQFSRGGAFPEQSTFGAWSR